jgi:hypothetical protein
MIQITRYRTTHAGQTTEHTMLRSALVALGCRIPRVGHVEPHRSINQPCGDPGQAYALEVIIDVGQPDHDEVWLPPLPVVHALHEGTSIRDALRMASASGTARADEILRAAGETTPTDEIEAFYAAAAAQ